VFQMFSPGREECGTIDGRRKENKRRKGMKLGVIVCVCSVRIGMERKKKEA
jgi:hypothetical protein